MKVFKKIAVLLLVAVMSLSVTGCLHKKDEIAVTINDMEFTSAYYMCALINANMEARGLVDEALTEDEKLAEVDYTSKKVEGKKFVDWVEDKAIESIKKIAAYKLLCKENKIELDEEKLASVDNYITYVWSGYVQNITHEDFEQNGVSQDTFRAFTTDMIYGESYFEFLYGKEGKKAIADKDIKSKMNENFQIGNILEANIDASAATNGTDIKKTLEGYAADLKAGKKTFEQVYVEYNKEENHSHEETGDGPKDPHAQIIGAEDTNYSSPYYYEQLKAMKVGEVKVINTESGTGFVLLVKQDINVDPYYLKTLDSDVRHLIADDEFDKSIADYAKKLKIDIDDYAIGQFDVEDIKKSQAVAY